MKLVKKAVSKLASLRQSPKTAKLRVESLETRELLSLSNLAPEFIPAQPSPLAFVSQDDQVRSTIPIELGDLNTGAEPQTDAIAVTVTTASDLVDAEDGRVSLREALATTGVTNIYFDPSLQGQTITLGSPLTVSSPKVAIDATALWNAQLNSPGLTIDANAQGHAFEVSSRALELSGLKIVNAKTSSYGGAIYLSLASLTVDSCVLENNEAQFGGAIFAGGSSVSISNSVIVGNRATRQSGAFHLEYTGCELSITNSVVANNSAQWGGVAVSYNGPITARNTTFANNSASLGGGAIYIDGQTLAAYNSIFALNSAAQNNDVQRVNGARFTAYNSLLEGDVCDNEDGYLVVRSGESLFVAQENRDYRLSPHSKAVDAGLADYAIAKDGNMLETDLRGLQRTVGDAVDLGAYEYHPEVDPNVAPTLADSYRDFFVAAPWYDADKYPNNTDSDQCWAGSASNMLWSTKWGRIEGLTDEEDLFHNMFGANFPNAAGNEENAILWLLNNEQLTDVVRTTPGGIYAELFTEYNESAGLYCGMEDAFSVNGIVDLATRLRSGYAVGISIANYNTSTGARANGHALTVYGYAYNPALAPSDPRYYTRLYVADSNDGGRMTGERDRKIVAIDLQWTENLKIGSTSRAGYLVSNYKLGDASYGPVVFDYFTFLTQRPAKYAPDASPSANLFFAETLRDAPISFTTDGAGKINETTFVQGGEIFANFAFQSTTALANDQQVACKLYVDDECVATVTATNVAQGASSSYKLSLGALQPGLHFITVRVDPENDVRESNEDDNAFSIPLTITETESIVVTTASDVVNPNDGLTSLREALDVAGTYGYSDRITFDEALRGQTLELTSGEITVSRSVVVDATALWDAENERPGVTLSGAGSSRVFFFNNSERAQVIGLAFTNGVAGSSNSNMGGALLASQSNVTIERCLFDNNRTSLGGAICVENTDLTIVD